MSTRLVRSIQVLIDQVREDLAANQHHWTEPGFHAVAVYRFGVWTRALPCVLGSAGAIVHRLLYILVRNIYGIELPRHARIGRRLRIAHQGGIVVVEGSEIGDDCILRHNATVGRVGRERKGRRPFPIIGNRVEIGAGAVIMGGIVIGDDARIGPNAVVMTDVPAGGSAFAPPARIMKPLSRREGPV